MKEKNCKNGIRVRIGGDMEDVREEYPIIDTVYVADRPDCDSTGYIVALVDRRTPESAVNAMRDALVDAGFYGIGDWDVDDMCEEMKANLDGGDFAESLEDFTFRVEDVDDYAWGIEISIWHTNNMW